MSYDYGRNKILQPFALFVVGPYHVRFLHDPDQPWLWREVTCLDCHRLLAEGKVDEMGACGFATQDALKSLNHECEWRA